MLAVALALAATLPLSAQAGWSVGAGYVDEVEGQSSHMFSLAYLTEATHPWEFRYGYIAKRDKPGELNTPTVNFLAASKQFTWRGWFVNGGIAWTDSDTEVLSKHWQFMTGLGWRNRHFAVSLRHLSNANTGGRNRGENFLLAEYRF